jgi:hypothetical protein
LKDVKVPTEVWLGPRRGIADNVKAISGVDSNRIFIALAFCKYKDIRSPEDGNALQFRNVSVKLHVPRNENCCDVLIFFDSILSQICCSILVYVLVNVKNSTYEVSRST